MFMVSPQIGIKCFYGKVISLAKTCKGNLRTGLKFIFHFFCTQSINSPFQLFTCNTRETELGKYMKDIHQH